MIGTIVTFYSFKGGVGRSMCLANVAVLLARKYKVLVIDFDLEAPGLEKYFADLKISKGRKQGGVLEIIENPTLNRRNTYKGFVQRIYHKTIKPIHFLSSGDQDDNYSSRVQNFDWNNFFEERNGALFLEVLRSELLESYDFVLIDSRTGYSDTSGICTYFMPDILVLLFSANNQSVQGTIEVADKSLIARQKLPYDRSNLTVLPIPSRIDKTEEYGLMKQWNHQFKDLFSKYYEEWFPIDSKIDLVLEEVSIPYLPYYSFGEKLAVLEKDEMTRKASPAYYYNQISKILDGSFFSDTNSVEDERNRFNEFIKRYASELSERQISIVRYIYINGSVSSSEVRKMHDVAYDTVNRDVKKLMALELIGVTGGGRSTKYIAGTELQELQ